MERVADNTGQSLNWRGLVAALLLGVLVLGGSALTFRLVQIHRDYGVWALSPGASTPTIRFHERIYNRGRTLPRSELPTTLAHLGTAPANGEVLGQPTTGNTPTVLWISYPDGKVTEYSLTGGP